MAKPRRKQPIRFIAGALFSLAALVWLAATLASTADRPLHIATTLIFALTAAIWFVGYLVVRSKG